MIAFLAVPDLEEIASRKLPGCSELPMNFSGSPDAFNLINGAFINVAKCSTMYVFRVPGGPRKNKTVFGFVVSVPIKSQATVKAVYQLPDEINFKKNTPIINYNLLFQKQPGTGADPLTVEFTHPAYIQVVATQPHTDITPQIISYTSDLAVDRLFSITLTK